MYISWKKWAFFHFDEVNILGMDYCYLNSVF